MFWLRALLVAVLAFSGAWGAVQLLSRYDGRPTERQRPHPQPPRQVEAKSVPNRVPSPSPFALYGDGFIDDSGYPLGYLNTDSIRDRGSLAEMVAASRGRTQRGVARLREELTQKYPGAPQSPLQAVQMSRHVTMIALLYMYEGQFAEADRWIGRAAEFADYHGVPAELKANMLALRGVAALRRGETENCIDCLGPSSCIFPIAPEAVHLLPSGSRAAVGYFTDYLKVRPEDLGVRWLLNVAYMTLGEYPGAVPPTYRIPLEPFRSAIDVGRFENVAPLVGLKDRPPNMSGGSIFDDFTGDGWPDIFITSTDWEFGAALFVNRGDGTFEDRSSRAGLQEQVMALNCAQADFDNDGDLDIVMTRGAWEDPYRVSLLRNAGDGSFQDVTEAAGLARPIAGQVAAWGDYDNDGFVDLFIGGEFITQSATPAGSTVDKMLSNDPRNQCRLYRNRGDGTFVDVAAAAGVENGRWTKGAAWGDYDDDGWVDLYVANLGGSNRLYHNNGDGTFTDLAQTLGVREPLSSFACWFWDYDNDGRLDLYVSGNWGKLKDVVADYLGQPNQGERPRLYHNEGRAGFRNVATQSGLNRVLLSMGSSFADIDNDGYLDFYLGTGRPPYSLLIPNVMFKNVEGKRFEDVTTSSGTGHLQKGHGVSFADGDGDGDLDLFVQVGGATPGDRGRDLLFRNPGHGRHWLQIHLVGTKTNRAAFGAKIRVDLKGSSGKSRSIYRRIGGNSSFGGSSLTEMIGLDDATTVTALTVSWPVSRTSQTFHDLTADQCIEITEGVNQVRVVRKPRAPAKP